MSRRRGKQGRLVLSHMYHHRAALVQLGGSQDQDLLLLFLRWVSALP